MNKLINVKINNIGPKKCSITQRATHTPSSFNTFLNLKQMVKFLKHKKACNCGCDY